MEKSVIKGYTANQIAIAFAPECTTLLGNSYSGRDGRSTLQNISIKKQGMNSVEGLGTEHKFENWKELIQAQLKLNRDNRLNDPNSPQQYLNLNYFNQDGNQCMAQILSCFNKNNQFIVVRVEESVTISATGFSGGFGNDSLVRQAANIEEEQKTSKELTEGSGKPIGS